jgi:geranylgeranyl pyrophosphate synthase
MKTLTDKLREKLASRSVDSLIDLLRIYEDEKDIAKSYSAFAWLSCSGAGGTPALSEAMAEVIEGFYLATSIHDDVLDSQDELVQRHRSSISPNSYLILGDCFFVQIAAALARATPMIPRENLELTIQRFERYLLDTAESQVADEDSQGTFPTREAAVRQMKLRGGTWGRLCTEVPALAAGLSEPEATQLGDAGENLFMGLTVRDDLRDLRDDISNRVLTLAPAIFLEKYDEEAFDFRRSVEPNQIDALVDLLSSEGAIDQSLSCGRAYTAHALSQLSAFLEDKEGMNWFLLQMIFRLTNKRIREFTRDDVRTGQLGIGFSALNEMFDAEIQG